MNTRGGNKNSSSINQRDTSVGAGDYMSPDEEKENFSDESNGVSGQENEMKRKLFDNLKKAGVLDGMKSTLRVRLYEQLRLKAEKPKDRGENKLLFKLAVSLVADLMQKSDMPYALSVFLPESGLSGEAPLSKPELLDLLNLKNDEVYASSPGTEFTPLLLDLVRVLHSQKSLRPNRVSSAVQTDDATMEQMSLEQKLRRIDSSMKGQQEAERLMPFKTLEERMLKYKKELEAKYANDLESEVRRLREFEMSKIRIEEAQRYRQKIQEYRDELELLQGDKLRELKLRESEAWERIKNKERDLDKQAFEIR